MSSIKIGMNSSDEHIVAESPNSSQKENQPNESSSTTNKSQTKRSYNRLEFSLEQEEEIIEYVRANPPLYNPKEHLYKNKTYRDRMWNDFGAKIEKSGEIFS